MPSAAAFIATTGPHLARSDNDQAGTFALSNAISEL